MASWSHRRDTRCFTIGDHYVPASTFSHSLGRYLPLVSCRIRTTLRLLTMVSNSSLAIRRAELIDASLAIVAGRAWNSQLVNYAMCTTPAIRVRQAAKG